MLVNFKTAQEKWDGLVSPINEETEAGGSYVKCAESQEVFLWARVSIWCVQEYVAPGIIVLNTMFNGELGKIIYICIYKKIIMLR